MHCDYRLAPEKQFVKMFHAGLPESIKFISHIDEISNNNSHQSAYMRDHH